VLQPRPEKRMRDDCPGNECLHYSLLSLSPQKFSKKGWMFTFMKLPKVCDDNPQSYYVS
jgi:hypothetical protein